MIMSGEKIDVIMLGSNLIKPNKIFTLTCDEEWWKLPPTLKSHEEPIMSNPIPS